MTISAKGLPGLVLERPRSGGTDVADEAVKAGAFAGFHSMAVTSPSWLVEK